MVKKYFMVYFVFKVLKEMRYFIVMIVIDLGSIMKIYMYSFVVVKMWSCVVMKVSNCVVIIIYLFVCL